MAGDNGFSDDTGMRWNSGHLLNAFLLLLYTLSRPFPHIVIQRVTKVPPQLLCVHFWLRLLTGHQVRRAGLTAVSVVTLAGPEACRKCSQLDVRRCAYESLHLYHTGN